MGQILFPGGLFPVVPEDNLPRLKLREISDFCQDYSGCLLNTQDCYYLPLPGFFLLIPGRSYRPDQSLKLCIIDDNAIIKVYLDESKCLVVEEFIPRLHLLYLLLDLGDPCLVLHRIFT